VEIEPIKTVSDYKAALKEIESLMSSALGTLEGNRLSMKVTKFVLPSI
jgi:antitoxin component HigA of HigAB toxin-antitoxin module